MSLLLIGGLLSQMHQIKNQEVEKYLPYALSIALRTKLGAEQVAALSRAEKVLITKLTKNLNILCKMDRKEVVEYLRANPSYQPVLSQLYFEQTLNNWRMLTGDPQPHSHGVLAAMNSNQCIGIDYRVEFTLSTISKKKVMKPVIFLIFTMKGGRLEIYLTLDQFSKLRYKVANAIKSVYSIEMKALF